MNAIDFCRHINHPQQPAAPHRDIVQCDQRFRVVPVHPCLEHVPTFNAGIAIGAFLKFGAGYSIMLGVLFYITATEVKHIKDTEYKLPWEAMWRTLPRERIEQPRPAATAPTAPAAPFRGQTLSRTQSAPGA